MNSHRYALIAGQGRSGTNWILEILDLSRQTHCRNEPNECIGSALAGLPSGRVLNPSLGSQLERAWDETVRRTSQSFGARDQSPVIVKDHFSQAAQRTGLVRLARSKRLRKLLSRVNPSAVREEWAVPSWIVDNRLETSSLPVLKLNMVPGWIVWALQNRPQAQVVHIVRHPGGFLNSLTERFWSTLDMGKVEHDNRERLAEVAASDPSWADRFGDLAVLSPVEMELWYWRYACETIHHAGASSSCYQLVKYEELTRTPIEVSRSVYERCGLAWDAAIEQGIRQMSTESQAIAGAWRDRLAREHVAAIDRVLDDSPMRGWWAGSDRGRAELSAAVERRDRDLGLPIAPVASS